MTCIRLDPSGNNLGGRGFIAQVQVRRHHQLQGLLRQLRDNRRVRQSGLRVF